MHHLSKDDKDIADMIGAVDGGLKNVDVTVDNSGKNVNKGQSDLMSDEDREAAKEAGEEPKTKK